MILLISISCNRARNLESAAQMFVSPLLCHLYCLGLQRCLLPKTWDLWKDFQNGISFVITIIDFKTGSVLENPVRPNITIIVLKNRELSLAGNGDMAECKVRKILRVRRTQCAIISLKVETVA
jgi:hypothetical protein